MTTVAQVIRRFESQLGGVESPMGSNRVLYNDWYFGRPERAPWCATFVSWCFHEEGLPLPATTAKGFAYTPSGAAWFKRRGRWRTSSPRAGDVVFFDFPNDGVNRISHVGVVTGVGPGFVETIEGNTDERGGRTGGKVMRRTRSVGIVGYGIPEYAAAVPGTTTPSAKTTTQEVDDVQITQLQVTMGTDDEGRGNVNVPYPISRIVGFLPHSEVRPNVDGRYDSPPSSVTFTPDGDTTVVVVQGDEPRSEAHVWLNVIG